MPQGFTNIVHSRDLEQTDTLSAIEGNTLIAAETTIVIEQGITVASKPLKDHPEAIDHYGTIRYVIQLEHRGTPLTEMACSITGSGQRFKFHRRRELTGIPWPISTSTSSQSVHKSRGQVKTRSCRACAISMSQEESSVLYTKGPNFRLSSIMRHQSELWGADMISVSPCLCCSEIKSFGGGCRHCVCRAGIMLTP